MTNRGRCGRAFEALSAGFLLQVELWSQDELLLLAGSRLKQFRPLDEVLILSLTDLNAFSNVMT